MPYFDIDSLSANPLFTLILDSLADGVLIADGKGTIRYVNHAYGRLVGVNIADVVGRPIQEVRKGTRLPEVLASGRPLLGIRRSVNQVEYVADINPIIMNGKVLGAISIVRDITQLEELSSRLRVYSHRVAELKNKVKDIHRADYSFGDIVGGGREMTRLKTLALRVAETDVAVMILGESGTGKERFAHAIHKASPRADDPFVPINCAALPAHLLLSEIFGYEEGAFTGASKGGKLGLFEVANGGTLFLDEIGDMDFELQSKLLRVIESGEFIRIGGTKPIKVNVRIISATNKDVEKMIAEGRFREDLYYRLNVVSLQLPPLRRHLEDVPALVEYYLRRINAKARRHVTISAAAADLLTHYTYPGNIRELINILEFAASTCEGDEITPEDLPIINRLRSLPFPVTKTLAGAARMSERDSIVAALERHGATVAGKRGAAAELGISLATLYNKIKQYNIQVGR
jgi:PAS domain S-box-containing protein